MDQRRTERPAYWRGDTWSVFEDGASGWGRGYVFLGDGRYLEDEEIARYLTRHLGAIESTVKEMNGCFAVACQNAEGRSLLVTDRYGSVPLYTMEGTTLVASPDPWNLIGALDAPPTIDPLAAFDLLRLGYVAGLRTLIRGIQTLPPATIATVDAPGLTLRRYWRYGYRPKQISAETAEKQLAIVFDDIGARVGTYLGAENYRPALTLSGGLDSRVLAAVLPASFEGDFAALAYGVTGDPEVAVARDVATTVGLRFRESAITPDFFSSSLEESVRDVGLTTRFTCGLGIRSVNSSDLDVLIPGHTGDFITGGHLPVATAGVRTGGQLLRYLEFKHFRYPSSEALLRDLFHFDYATFRWSSLRETTEDFDLAADTFGLIDRWNIENRQRRLILMELRAYERAGRWLLPFYDHELVDFYATLPHELRLGQSLYLRTARNRIFRGHTSRLADLRRVGGSMRVDPALLQRVKRLRWLQPLSGWVLALSLAPLRDIVGARRTRTEQRYGTDPVKFWYRTQPEFRQRLRARLKSVIFDTVDVERLVATIESEGIHEGAYGRLVPGVLTVDECLKHAQRAWHESQYRV